MSVDGSSFSEVSVDPRPAGSRAVYMVELRDVEEARAVAKLFTDLKAQVRLALLQREPDRG